MFVALARDMPGAGEVLAEGESGGAVGAFEGLRG